MPEVGQSDKRYCGFPSHFVDPSVKQGREWNRQYVEAFHQEADSSPAECRVIHGNYARHQTLRKYGRGEQSEHQYKENMGLKKEKGKLNTSFRNLDFAILKVVPKLRNVLINKVMNQPYRLNIKPIDPASIAERRQYRAELTELVISQEHIKRSKFLSTMGLTSPVPPGEVPPQTLSEVEPYMDMHPKNMLAMEVKDYLTFAMYYNDWEQQSREVIGDIVDLSVGGFRLYVDTNGMVKFRRVFPERVISNRCLFPDFRDMIRCGEYHEITVSELKRRTGGTLGEETYKKLANKASEGGNKYDGRVQDYWNEKSFSYAYDVEKVTILDATWLSTDPEVWLEKTNSAGNNRMIKQPFDYVPYKGDKTVNDGRGYSDGEFNEKFKGQKQIYRKQVKNVYQCSWVVDSDVVYDFGLMKDMPRSVSDINETSLPYIFVSTDFISTIGTIEQPADQVQMNWLQVQSHTAASKPDGIAIEKKALARLANIVPGTKWDPKEALQMYAEIGSIVFDGYDAHGNPLPWLPIKELKNGLSEAAMQHFQQMIAMLDLMRQMLGINILTEGQTPPERLGKAVAQLSFGASDNALSHLNDCYSKLYERVSRQMVLLMQGSISRIDQESFNEALGFESYNVLSLNKDIGLRELGITIEEGPDQYLKDKISIILQKAIDTNQIPGDVAIAIEMEDNIYRQLAMMKKERLEAEKRSAGYQENLVRAQKEGEAAVQQQAAQAKLQEMQLSAQVELAKAAQANEHDRQTKQDEFMRAVVLKKLEANEKLELQEQNWLKKLFETTIKIKSDEKIATMQLEAAKEKPTPQK